MTPPPSPVGWSGAGGWTASSTSTIDVDLVLLRHWLPRTAVQRIVARSRPGTGRPSLGARVLAERRAWGATWPASGPMWLCSTEPAPVEELPERAGARPGLGYQLVGCLGVFEYGGADRLARLVGRNALGPPPPYV